MKELTDNFIALNAGVVSANDFGTPAMDYDSKTLAIRDRLASLPAAHILDLPTTHDWVYETCRIASLIYTTAIIQNVPFSVAADSFQDPAILGSHPSTMLGGYPAAPRLTEALYEALIRTDVASIWNNMSGVLYWVCAVGAAAARTATTVNMSQMSRYREEAYAVWVRRCLIMTSTRTVIVLIFQHPMPLLMAQKRLLKVQDLISRRPLGF
jgi:hypothetical protein